MPIRIRSKLLVQLLMAIVCAPVLFLQPTGMLHAADATAKSAFYLVSVGVGDADLITLRAVDTLRRSEVVVCGKKTKEQFAQYLEGKEVLDDSIAGWRTYGKDCSQVKDAEERAKCEKGAEARSELIGRIRGALATSKTLSVLCGGDPMIYGGPYRWYLEEFKDTKPVVVPGVSCFNAANAVLGRDIMLGKETKSAVLTTEREIEKMVLHHPTLVIFTMHTKFEDLVGKLKAHYPPQTPIAIVFYAGYKEKEHIVSGRLDTILEQTKGKEFPFEHLVYVGDFLNR